MEMIKNMCPKCNKVLNGLVFMYGIKWICSDCAEDKEDVLHCEHGCKVIVSNLDCGYDIEQEEAKNLFKVGEIYTVNYVEVGGFNSMIELLEFPNKKFNTVFFKRTIK